MMISSPKKKGIKSLPLYASLAMLPCLEVIAADTTIEEVLVTASKRGTQNIQDIPYNISAVGAGFIEKTGVDSFTDIAQVVPGLEAIDAGPKSTKFVIRGLAGDEGAAQTGVYLDEIPMTFAGGNVQQATLRMFDIERIEVLRGPQGTLYGEGSQGGTIRYITKKPNSNEWEGLVNITTAQVSHDGGTQLSVNGMINLPVIDDTLGVRAVLMQRDNDGLVDRPDLGINGSDDEETFGARVQALWNIGENTTALFSYHMQDLEQGDDTVVSEKTNSIAGFVRSPFEDELDIYNLTLEHEIQAGTFTLSSSQVERSNIYTFDVSQFTPVPSRVTQPRDREVTSYELRFASTFDGAVQFVAGAYYQENDRDGVSMGAFVDPATGLLPAPLDPGSMFFALRTVSETETKALFGEVSFDITNRFTLLVGARYFEVTSNEVQSVEVDVDIFGRTRGFLNARSSEDEDTVFKVQGSFDLTGDILMYATWAEGFRQGGGNTPFGPDPSIPLSYDPDYVTNYELGWKSTLVAGQLVLNGAIYFMEWDDIQVSQPDSTGATFFINNFGSAELFGLELEGSYAPKALPGFSVNFGFNLSDQTLTEDSPQVTTGQDGDTIPNTVGESISLGLEQRFGLLGQDGFARIDASYTGDSQTVFSRLDPQYREWGDYVLTNVRVGLEADNWSVSLFAKNLFDERKPVSWNVQDRPGIDDQIQIIRPLTIGVSASWRF